MSIFCAKCGGGLESGDSFCSNCGTKTGNGACSAITTHRKFGLLFIILLVIGLGLLVIFGIDVRGVFRGLARPTEVADDHVTSASKPSQDQVKRDCDQIAEATLYNERAAPSVDRFAGKNVPMFLCSEVKILGTSVEGKVADVMAEVTVKYTVDPRFGNMELGGFFKWVEGRDWRWDGFMSSRPAKGDTRLYRVTFKYRQFDTGWRLENYR
jgi:hypothetical protein